MSFRTFLNFSAISVVLSCSSKSSIQTLSREEKIAIDSLSIDSSLILDVKQVAEVDFIKMPGAVQAILENKKGEIKYQLHGIQVGYFDVSLDFDEALLIPIRKKWSSKGYKFYTVKQGGINRLMINL